MDCAGDGGDDDGDDDRTGVPLAVGSVPAGVERGAGMGEIEVVGTDRDERTDREDGAAGGTRPAVVVGGVVGAVRGATPDAADGGTATERIPRTTG
jgi:hypothetical protein